MPYALNNPLYWVEECKFISEVTSNGGLSPNCNNDKECFIRYCEMQRNAAEKAKFFDTVEYIEQCISDLLPTVQELVALNALNAILKRYLAEGPTSTETLLEIADATPNEYVSYSIESGYYVAMSSGPMSERMDSMEKAHAFIPDAVYAFNGDNSVFELISNN